MAWTTPGTATAGEVLTAAFWNTNVRDNLNEQFPIGATVTNFVPTLSGGWLLGNATYTAKYWQVGKMVSFFLLLTVGSTTTKGTSLYVAAPVTAAASDAFNGVVAMFEDVGSAFVPAFVVPGDTTRFEIGTGNASGTYLQWNGVSSTVPFTWATGDKIRCGGTYLAA